MLSLVDNCRNMLYCIQYFSWLTNVAHPSAKDLVLISEVARAAGVHVRTLERWATAGKIPQPKKLKANGRRVYTVAECETIIRFAKEVDPA